MNDQPLAVDPNETLPGDLPPDVPAALGTVSAGNGNGTKTSVVDRVLDLDDFLAADVRLARVQAAWYTKPDLEAKIEELNAELDALTDLNGRPLPVVDGSMEDERGWTVVVEELSAVQKEYAESRTYVLMEQLDQDDWDAFQTKWKDELAKNPPYTPEFYAELISKCAIRPQIPADKLAPFRKKVGAPVFEEVWRKAWNVNTRSGVSIPKSLLSSAVQSQRQRG